MVDSEKILSKLKAYEAELSDILNRFEHTRDGIYISEADGSRFRQMVIELRDFFDDVLGKNSYSFQIIKFFNEGIANFIGSPSYKSIENIRGVVSAVITRVERNPNVLISTEVTSKKPQHGFQDPELPKLVTLNWLWQHVPVKFWYILFGIIFGAFLLGIQASRLAIVREMFGY